MRTLASKCREDEKAGNLPKRAVVWAAMPKMISSKRSRRVLSMLALAASLVLVACSGAGTGPTPSLPTDRGPESPLPTGTPAPSPTSTAVPEGEIDHPTDPNAVVLRMHVGGGFVPFEYSLTESPVFTLYGDNSIIFRPSEEGGGRIGGPGPETRADYMRATMNPEQVDALLRFALTQGGLLDAEESYVDIGIADAPNTVFTVNAGGVEKAVNIAALGFDQPGPDAQMRQRFFRLADLLDSFEEQVAAGQVETVEPYQPLAYRAFLTESFGGVEPADWPWDDLSIDDFPQGDEPARSATLSPDQVAAVADEPTGSVIGLAVLDESGTVWQLSIRPLLPDEVDPVKASQGIASCAPPRTSTRPRMTRSGFAACGSRAWSRRWDRCGAWPA